MRGQNVADLFNRVDDCLGEPLIPEVLPHRADHLLPVIVPALLVNGLVPDYGEFVRTRRDKEEDCVAIASLLHAEPAEPLPRRHQRISVQLPSVNIHADLSRAERLRLSDRSYHAVVIDLAEELFGSHDGITNFRLIHRRRNFRLRR